MSNLSTMPYGKHRGEPIDEIPRDYLRWVASDQNLALLQEIREFLGIPNSTPESQLFLKFKELIEQSHSEILDQCGKQDEEKLVRDMTRVLFLNLKTLIAETIPTPPIERFLKTPSDTLAQNSEHSAKMSAIFSGKMRRKKVQ